MDNLRIKSQQTREDLQLIQDCQEAIEDEEFGESEGLPYADASSVEILEFKSFLDESPDSYKAHLEKKYKNLLIRVQMMFWIRKYMKCGHELCGGVLDDETGEEEYGRVFSSIQSSFKFSNAYYSTLALGKPIDVCGPALMPDSSLAAIPASWSIPVWWWGEAEDRDVLIGIIKWGYQSYDKIRLDSQLCFKNRNILSSPAPSPDSPVDDADDLESEADDNDDLTSLFGGAPSTQDDTSIDEPSELDRAPSLSDLLNQSNASQLDSLNGQLHVGAHSPPPAAFSSPPATHTHTNATAAGAKAFHSAPLLLDTDVSRSDCVKLVWPNLADLGNRIRKLASLFMKERSQDVKWVKRERVDFLKVLFWVGAPEPSASKRNWSLLSADASLASKSDVDVEIYYAATVKQLQLLAPEVDCEVSPATLQPDQLNIVPCDYYGKAVDTCEGVGADRAKRTLLRLSLLHILRSRAITDPHIDIKISVARKPVGFPDWYLPNIFDKALLLGISKHGFVSMDILLDPDLPFLSVVEEKCGVAAVEAAIGLLETTPKCKGEHDEFIRICDAVKWMREVSRVKRVQMLVEHVLHPSQKAQSKLNSPSTAADAENRSVGSTGRNKRSHPLTSTSTHNLSLSTTFKRQKADEKVDLASLQQKRLDLLDLLRNVDEQIVLYSSSTAPIIPPTSCTARPEILNGSSVFPPPVDSHIKLENVS